MSLLNNNNKKKDNKKNSQQRSNSLIPGPGTRGKMNTKGVSKQTKLTGGSQRGS
jgi:hypothetical protein